ncbi:MAG TPA: acyl-CoA dehydrogenase family protein [Kribbellaceae bacterium]|jgi:alkylation response protein AidB-like acyl-CoA dehydrogenase
MTTAQQDELKALAEAVRDLAGDAGGVTAARRRFDADPTPGYDEQVWGHLGRDMGLAGLGIPEDVGGVGGGLAELTVVAEELGRSLLPVPFFSSTVLAGQILARAATAGGTAGAEGPDVLAGLAAGERLAAFAGTDAAGCWRADQLGSGRLGIEVTGHDGAWRLNGTADFVLDGMGADYLVVAARGADGCDLFLVPAGDPQVQRRPLETLDPSRAVAAVGLVDAAASALTSGGTGARVVDEAVDVALVVLAAEQVGGAAACLDMAVDYAKIRYQFSRPIGGFQAIKHKLADLLLLVEMGRSAVDRALPAAGDARRLAEAAAVAKIWCSDAYTAVSAENVHVHGGTGFTWEHDAHLYFRRARADAALLGDAVVHRERLAALLGW